MSCPQAEKLFKQALKYSETLLRNRTPLSNDSKEEAIHSKDLYNWHLWTKSSF